MEESVREIKLMGNGVRLLADICKNNSNPFLIHIPGARANREDLMTLKNILNNFRGNAPVVATLDLPAGLCKI